jgi:hypothetical protein
MNMMNPLHRAWRMVFAVSMVVALVDAADAAAFTVEHQAVVGVVTTAVETDGSTCDVDQCL